MPKYITGLFVNQPKESAPDFVKGGLGIHVDNFIAWLKDQETTDRGYLRANIDLLESKDGELYAKLNEWYKDRGGRKESQPAHEVGDDVPF